MLRRFVSASLLSRTLLCSAFFMVGFVVAMLLAVLRYEGRLGPKGSHYTRPLQAGRYVYSFNGHDLVISLDRASGDAGLPHAVMIFRDGSNELSFALAPNEWTDSLSATYGAQKQQRDPIKTIMDLDLDGQADVRTTSFRFYSDELPYEIHVDDSWIPATPVGGESVAIFEGGGVRYAFDMANGRWKRVLGE